jgi:AcrR family transcriptional regulator
MTRTYRSDRRAEQAARTRAAILDAARDLFGRSGFAATGVRDIATAAGVSVETVYATYGSKAQLFAVALDGAVVGDDEPVPFAERPEMARMAAGVTLYDRAVAAADVAADVNGRTVGLHRALHEGARTDENLADQSRLTDARRRESVAASAVLVAGRRITPTERDALWALTAPELHDLLIGRSGWTVRRYKTWLADTIVHQLTKAEGQR